MPGILDGASSEDFGPKPPPKTLAELCSHCGNKIAIDVSGNAWCIVCGRQAEAQTE